MFCGKIKNMRGNRSLKDKSAEKEISSFIVKQKERGVSKISIPEVSDGLNLSPRQVDRIMEKFEEEGRITEV